MTATTKEQRERLRNQHKKLMDARKFGAHPGNSVVDELIAYLLPAVADSERLAAIESVTGEEVKAMVGQCRFQARFESLDPEYERFMLSVADALLSLSTKVEEQAEEIYRLRIAIVTGSSAFRRAQEMHDAAADERDTLFRLLTEMAVPALAEIANSHDSPQNDEIAEEAISTIRAHMEGGDDY